MKYLLLLMMFISLSVQAQTWEEFYKEGKATYVGGYYYAVCRACLDGSYQSYNGYWSCSESNKPYEQGCASSILKAIVGSTYVQPVR